MASVIDIEAASLLKEMAGKGVKVFRAGGSQNRKVTVNSGGYHIWTGSLPASVGARLCGHAGDIPHTPVLHGSSD